jgi:acyl carrier protein
MGQDLYEQVAGRLLSMLAAIKQLPAEAVTLDADDDFLRQFDMDSIDAVELTIQLDSEFGLGFGQDPDDLDALSSFGSLVDLVIERGQLGVVS